MMNLDDLDEFPWDSLVKYRHIALNYSDGLIDLSVGSPVDATPELAHQSLCEVSQAQSYPQAIGIHQLRNTIQNWFFEHRNAKKLEVEHVLPTIGSKEAIAFLPAILGLGAKDTVVYPTLAYPTYAVGAKLVGAQVKACDDPQDWPETTKLVWINSPSNPDGRVLDVIQLRAILQAARDRNIVVASDECYAQFGLREPWITTPIPSILDSRVCEDVYENILCFYSLSKQSNLAGYRAAFLAGDVNLIDRIHFFRRQVGLMVPTPVQHVMNVLLADHKHVQKQHELYRWRYDTLKPAFVAAGFQIEQSYAGLYLWATQGKECWESVEYLAKKGILVAPGCFYEDSPSSYVRIALTATSDEIVEATKRLLD